MLCLCPLYSAVVLLALADAPPAARSDDLARLMPAETEFFAYVNLRQIITSKLTRTYLEKEGAEMKKQFHEDKTIKDFVERTGVKPFEDVEQFVFAFSDIPAGEEKVLLAFSGNFDPKKLTAAAESALDDLAAKYKEYDWGEGGKVVKVKTTVIRKGGRKYFEVTFVATDGTMKAELLASIRQDRGRPFLELNLSAETKKNGTVEKRKYDLLATVDRRLLVIGTRDSVLAGLDRSARGAGTGVRKKGVADAFARISPGTVLAVRDSNKTLKGLPGLETPTTAKFIEKIAAVEFDLRLTADIKVIGAMEFKDLDAAKELKPVIAKLTEQAKALLLVATLTNEGLKPLEALGESLKLTSKGRTITVEATLVGEGIKDLLKAASGK